MVSRFLIGFTTAAILLGNQADSAVTTLTVSTAGDSGFADVGTFASNAGDLRGVLNYINLFPAGSGNSYSVIFALPSGSETITLQKPLPIVNLNAINALTINGSNSTGSGTQVTLSGNSLFRGFFVRQANTSNPVTIQNMTLMSCKATGGTGGTPAGGGGMGAGGGIFADTTVTGSSSLILSNITFNGCAAVGGNGGPITTNNDIAGGGGGGMGGMGGGGGTTTTQTTNGGGGGGGLFGQGGNGGSATAAGAAGGGGGGGSLGLGGTGGSANTGGGGGGGGATVTATGGGGASTAGAVAGSSSGLIPTGTTSSYVAGGGGGGAGTAGTGSAAGGGGIYGGAAGGTASTGGGGGGSFGSSGAPGSGTTGGLGGNGSGGGGSGGGVGGAGGNGGGGGGGILSVGGAGGYGGGGGGNTGVNNTGATGGIGGGGGGTAGGFTAAAGGFGGGGGGASNVAAGDTGGAGGFGGGGGGGKNRGTGGQGGGSGGTAVPGGGGSGAALGGAMFVAGSGALELRGGVTTSISGTAANTVTAGTAPDSTAGIGTAAATDIFVQTGTSLVFNPVNTTDSITIAGTIGDDASGTLTGGSAVAGTGTGASITKNGLGTLTLSGSNTWGKSGGTGTFTFNAGTVQVNSATSLGNGANSVVFAGNATEAVTASYTNTQPHSINSGVVASLSVAAGFTWTSSAVISGSGTLAKQGGGTMVLNSLANTYSGGTQLNTGVTQINAQNNLGTGALTFIGNGTLQLAAAGTYAFPSITLNSGVTGTIDVQTFTVTLPSPISGTGGLRLASTGGGGVLLLNSANTYSGVTTVSAGTLQAGASGAFSSSSQFNVSGGTLALASSNQTIGSLTGSSGTVSLGLNTLTMGGDNTSPSAFAGVISGTGGSVVKVGTGTIGISGTNTYTGSTTISGGRLNILGSIVGSVTVNSGGTLGGNGLVGGSVTVGPGASITPGTSIGTLTIMGNLTLNSTSQTNLEINPTNSSVIGVVGSAALAGALNVTVDSGNYSSTVYPFLTSAGITGAFSSVTFSGNIPTGFVGYLTYSPTSVSLNITVPPAFAGSNVSAGNARNVGNALNGLRSNTAYSSLLASLFSLPANQLQTALNSIVPARNSMDAFTNMMGTYSFVNGVSARLSVQRSMWTAGMGNSRIASISKMAENELTAQNQEKSPRRPRGSARRAAAAPEENCFWFEALGDWASQTGQNQMPDTNFITRGLFAGYDFFGYENGMIGIAAGFAKTDLGFAEAQGTADLYQWTIGPYGAYYFCNAFAEFGAFFTIDQNNNNRHIFYPGFDAHARSNHMSYQLTPHFAIGYDWVSDYNILEPFVSADLIMDWESSYTESGAGLLNMSMQGKMMEMLRTEAGLRAYQVLNKGWGICVLKEQAGYVNRTPFGTSSFQGAVLGTTNSFTYEGFTISQDLLEIGLEAFVKGNNGLFGSAAYTGEYFSGYLSNEAQITVGIYF